MVKKRILCFATHYLPGFKFGGPLRSLLHIQEWLEDEFEFRIVTRDRDLGETYSYPNQPTRKWSSVRGAMVWYLRAPYWWPVGITAALVDVKPDLLYFQSALDPALTIVPLLLRRVGLISRATPALVAPRGEFSKGALSLKRGKKATYLWLARAVGLYSGVTWHATERQEAEEIRDLWGREARVILAPNLPGKGVSARKPRRLHKQPKTLRLVFLSRISRKKNLHGVLEILRGLEVAVSIDVYGTKEDLVYWSECESAIEKLPAHIQAHYRGAVQPDDVIATLANYDVFILPTLGENFGHVILEALLAGCPVILSNTTPWRDLSASHVGFDIALGDTREFRRAISLFAAMSPEDFDEWSRCARDRGERYCANDEIVGMTRQMLSAAVVG